MMIETTPEPTTAGGRWLSRLAKGTEETILTATLALVTILLLFDAIGRPLGGIHIPGKDEYVKQLTLWLAFVGGLAAAMQGKHLTLSTSEFFGDGLARRLTRLFAFSVAAAASPRPVRCPSASPSGCPSRSCRSRSA